ncbi:MAG: serine hydrolase [Planctomycetes bacterium]|jgi:CubicO group peptidase (beta-lactamase class C family)|nr:serine hydrolase [Planctomycetota bacterium]
MVERQGVRAGFVFLILAAGASSVVGQGSTGVVWPGVEWETVAPEQVGMDRSLLEKARACALTGGGSGMITRHGKVVLQWGDPKQTYDLKSSTKAIGVTAVGLALLDGKFPSLHDPASKYHPQLGIPPESNREKGYLGQITLFHLATQTAGFDKNGGYTELLFAPGTKWAYSDGGPNWLAECVTLVYGRDLQELMFERVFAPIGIGRSDLQWRANSYRPKEINGIARREFGSGISANVPAMARIGYLYLRQGRWQDRQILPSWFVDAARTVPNRVRGLPGLKPESYDHAADHYGLLWWNNADATMKNVPRDTYWSWGLYDSLIVVIPSLDIVISRAGKSVSGPRTPHYAPIEPFIEPVVLSVQDRGRWPGAPYPASEVIRNVAWAPADTIVRQAEGGDNWPTTWADDGNLYTAYGDAQGFQPRVEKKLSLGLARVTGGPADVQGVNLRSPTGETVGEGARGAKASGMLCVDGVLYMLIRNVGNSQVAWSGDHAVTWQRCDWKFETGFGAPTFLNYGANYAGRRDDYVYLYSADSDSAYLPADRMVLARVPMARIRARQAYEFFQGLDAAGQALWTKDIRDRGAVFVNPGQCYRSGISYNAGLKRFLWCQVLPFSTDSRGPRFQGGFGIYEAPAPWGPWRTVFHTTSWDVGPGETSSLPTKWMSPDGRTCHLLFSGNDCFSVRQVEFR